MSEFPFGQCDCGGPLGAHGECLGNAAYQQGTLSVEEFDQEHASAVEALRQAKSFIVITLDEDGQFEGTHITDRRDLRTEMAFLEQAMRELQSYYMQRMESGDYGYGFYPLYTPEDAEEMMGDDE